MSDIVPHSASVQAWLAGIDFDTDTLMVCLLKDTYAPDPDHDSYADVSAHEVDDGNGYTTGGVEVTGAVTVDDTNNRAVVDVSDAVWTASGGSIGPARYAAIYDDTHANDLLVYIFDLGSNRTAESGIEFKIDINAVGLFVVVQA